MPQLNLLHAYRAMAVMRRFEEAVGDAVRTGEIHGEMHLGLGQEAIASALAPLLRPGDAVLSTHRPHLHALAHGLDPVSLLGELLERDGLCHGKGGHMHLFDPDRAFMCSGIVGASAPIATGYALARKRAGRGAIAVAVLGDGAMNQGGVLEALNLAAAWRLPLLFLCEDNGYGISVRRDVASAGALVDRGMPFGIPSAACDGTDPQETFAALEPAVRRARRGDGPALVVAAAYRFSGHYEGDSDAYRPAEERTRAMSAEFDPLARARTRLIGEGRSAADLDRIDGDAARRVSAWMEEARALPLPDPDRVREDVYA